MKTSPRRIIPSSWLILANLLTAFFVGTSALISFRAPLAAQVVQATPSESTAQENRKTKFTIQPEYPELARKNNISGTARVQAVIAPDGSVKEVKILGGSPVLVQAVVDAVKKWKYEAGPTVTTAVLKFDFKNTQ